MLHYLVTTKFRTVSVCSEGNSIRQIEEAIRKANIDPTKVLLIEPF